MKKRSVTHTTFVIERTCAAPPARVFKAFSDPVDALAIEVERRAVTA